MLTTDSANHMITAAGSLNFSAALWTPLGMTVQPVFALTILNLLLAVDQLTPILDLRASQLSTGANRDMGIHASLILSI